MIGDGIGVVMIEGGACVVFLVVTGTGGKVVLGYPHKSLSSSLSSKQSIFPSHFLAY